MRIIRWVGHPSPLYDPAIAKMIERHQLPVDTVLAFEMFEHNRKVSVKRGQSRFTLEKRHGYAQDYVWGPQIFDVEMTDRDWARLSKLPIDSYMFMDVTNGVPPTGRPKLSVAQWRELMQSAAKTPAPTVLMPPGKL